MFASLKMVYHLLYQILVFGDGEPSKAHVSLKDCFFQFSHHQITFEGIISFSDNDLHVDSNNVILMVTFIVKHHKGRKLEVVWDLCVPYLYHQELGIMGSS